MDRNLMSIPKPVSLTFGFSRYHLRNYRVNGGSARDSRDQAWAGRL